MTTTTEAATKQYKAKGAIIATPKDLPRRGIGRAACRDYDPELWFSDFKSDREFAKAVCSGCAARVACGLVALALPPSTAGIWAGLDENDRRELRKAA